MDLGLGKAAEAADADLIKNATTATFTKDVIEASKGALVLVDFWAAWCGPCKQLTPIIEKVVRTYKGKVRLVKVDVDANQAVAAQLRVQSLPTVYAFRDGRPVDGFMGAQPETAVKAFIDRLVGDDEADDLAAAIEDAEKAFEAGDLQTAAETFAAVLQHEAQNVAALAGLAKCYLKSGDIEHAEQTIALVPPDKRDTAAVSSVRAALDLAKNAVPASDLAPLKAKVEANPADHQARIDYATALAASGAKGEAVDELIASIRRDRKWNDEAARKQLVLLFEAWGFKDPDAIEGRRKLSSVLFS
jgi:putative thioredoxin